MNTCIPIYFYFTKGATQQLIIMLWVWGQKIMHENIPALEISCTNFQDERVRFMVVNVTFNNFSVIRGGEFYWRRKTEYRVNPADLP